MTICKGEMRDEGKGTVGLGVRGGLPSPLICKGSKHGVTFYDVD